MTLQEAKDEVVKKYGWKDWNHYQLNYQVGLGTTYEQRIDEAAELYARSKWEEGRSDQYQLMQEHCMKFHKHVLLEVPKPEFKP
jgi:hypothetical protein